jgi:hypothetical protein
MTDQYLNVNLFPEEIPNVLNDPNVKDYSYSKRDDCDNGLGLFTAGAKNMQPFTCVIESGGDRHLVESYSSVEASIEGHERWLSYIKDQASDFPVMAYDWTEYDGESIPVTVKVCPKSF